MKKQFLFYLILLNASIIQAQFYIGNWESKYNIKISSKTISFENEVRFIISLDKESNYKVLPKNKSLLFFLKGFDETNFKGYKIKKSSSEEATITLTYKVKERSEKFDILLKKVNQDEILAEYTDKKGKQTNIKLFRKNE